MFYLTSSRFNGFESLKNWLSKPENSKYTTSIESIFFLDSFASNPELYLQIFHSENDPSEKHFSLYLEVKINFLNNISKQLSLLIKPQHCITNLLIF